MSGISLIRPYPLLLAAVVAALGAFYWLTLPPTAVVLNQECVPRMGHSQVSAAIYGDDFWQAQLTALGAERDELEKKRAKSTQATAAVQGMESSARALMAEFDRDHPELAPPMAKQQVAALRRAAGEIDRREAYRLLEAARVNRMEWLDDCTGEVRGRLAAYALETGVPVPAPAQPASPR